ncbi:MAG: prepilin-type N-terminal cleavage/methylation domain-containing protein [Comamonas sp.]
MRAFTFQSTARKGQRGMTLLELLVALAIMAISLGMIYRATGSSARSVGDLDRYQYAVQLAESLMASRDSVYESGWNEAGESNGYQWSIQSAPFKTDVGEAPNIPLLHEVHIAVTWSDGDKSKLFELTTLRAQRKPPDPAENRGQQ